MLHTVAYRNRHCKSFFDEFRFFCGKRKTTAKRTVVNSCKEGIAPRQPVRSTDATRDREPLPDPLRPQAMRRVAQIPIE
jgi:hypothetical protein